MEYLYYKAKHGNFGDDLNDWLWPQFFGDGKQSDSSVFLGIGSILFNDFEQLKSYSNHKKIVFGTGVRPTNKRLILDDTWEIRFLRGPLSSLVLSNQYDYITDSAYGLRLTSFFDQLKYTPKKHEVGFIPYFKSTSLVDWESLCRDLGFCYISPLNECGIEETLLKIASCKRIITEAMHGAIIADLLRIPWRRFVLSTPFTESQMVSEFKWNDWMYSVNLCNIEFDSIKMFRKTPINKIIRKLTFDRLELNFLIKDLIRDDLFKQYSNEVEFFLSNDSIIEKVDEQIFEKIEELKKCI